LTTKEEEMKYATTTISIAAVVALLTTGWAPEVVHAQPQPVCLHGPGETPADAARRQDAVRVMRAINTAQAQAFAMNRTYLNFRDLTNSGLAARPVGFATQLTVEGSTYALLLKDTTDPCGYTLFSDQEGLIYVGSPLSEYR
jgi:hypothetical protein